jgi:hypothetical protein
MRGSSMHTQQFSIKDAGHIICVMKPQFKDEIVKWIGDHAAK